MMDTSLSTEGFGQGGQVALPWTYLSRKLEMFLSSLDLRSKTGGQS